VMSGARLAEADEPREIGWAHPFPLGQRGKRHAIADSRHHRDEGADSGSIVLCPQWGPNSGEGGSRGATRFDAIGIAAPPAELWRRTL
jgi:hypothetical protein